ncbi:MAG: NAD(P)-dependent alcohol dehydrogenase [Halanaerobiaceae bacterium]
MAKMKAAYLKKEEELEFKEIKKPDMAEDEVLVQIKSVGICGSDMHYYKHGRIGEFVVEEPLILGHEAAGEIKKVGEKVKDLKPGDRVAVEPGVPCRVCEFCKTGKYHLCPDVVFMATPPVDGAFVEYVNYPADFVYKLPDNVSYEEGAMIEPMVVGMNAAQKADITLGDKVIILGAGPIGLVTLQAVKAAGSSDITITDINQMRLDKAEELGATRTINVQNEEIKDAGEYDVVLEAAGVINTTQQTADLVKRGGRIVLIGMTPEESFDYPVSKILSKEATVKGIFRYANLYKRAIKMIKAGQVELESMISDRFNFKQLPEAFTYADKNREETIKVMINFD